MDSISSNIISNKPLNDNQLHVTRKQIALRNILPLAKGFNAQGDIFNLLVCEAFYSLGFDKPTFNLQEVGHEIDIVLEHRTEKKIALVESKATKDPIGGDAVNKFVGALMAEIPKYTEKGYQVVAYYVSRSGFKATAIRQEEARRNANLPYELILLSPDMLVEELVHGNAICSADVAAASVRVAKEANISQCRFADLIACHLGWVWAVYFSDTAPAIPTHYTLVHSDGSVLSYDFAEQHFSYVIESASFTGLYYYDPVVNYPKERELLAVKQLYYNYLRNELGEITFEGLPADNEAGVVRVKLENIYVPLRFDTLRGKEPSVNTKTSVSSGHMVRSSQRAAVLAKPGGGKTTLIRRIALSYADPKTRDVIDDNMPDNDYFPVYIRCRDLGSSARKSIREIIAESIVRAELPQYQDAFLSLVEESLLNGMLYLLVDGLDEISDPQVRLCFVQQLRLFSAMYPKARMLLTSRETGYSSIAGVLRDYCDEYRICSLDEDQIRALCLNWHMAITPDQSQAYEESKQTCRIILSSSRIKSLADNPLLLTTLLFVKRWVGYLPTKKCQLYSEMIKLLLVSWNVAAHGSIDLDEAEPQLAYIAYQMTKAGVQTVPKSKLLEYISDARKALPEYLEYTQYSPHSFVEQVEMRSSLLIQKGLEPNDRGHLEATYEFSHLSFQEYLTAVAISEEWLPSEDQELSSVELLNSQMDKPQWAEVIPMAAFLLGKKSRPIIEALVQKSEEETAPSVDILEANMGNYSAILLANCLALEVPMRDDSLRRCVRTIINNQASLESTFSFPSLKTFTKEPEVQDVFDVVLHSKFGTRFQEIAKDLLINDSETIPFLLSYSKTIASFQSLLNPVESDEKREQSNFNTIESTLIELCLAVKYPQFYIEKVSDEGGELGTIILEHLLSPNQKESLLSCLMLCAVVPNQIFGAEFSPENYANRRSESYFDSVSSLVDALLQIWIRGSEYPNVVSTVNRTICLYLISFFKEIQIDARKYKATDTIDFSTPKRLAFYRYINKSFISSMENAPYSTDKSSDDKIYALLDNPFRKDYYEKNEYLEIINDESEQYLPEAVRSKLFKLGDNEQNNLGQPLKDYLEDRYSNPIVESDCKASILFGLWYHVWDRKDCRQKIEELFSSRSQADLKARVSLLFHSGRYWGHPFPAIFSIDDIENKSLSHLMDYFNDRWRNNRPILFNYLAKHLAKDSEGPIRVVNRPHALEIIEEFEKKQHSDDGEKNPKYKILSNSSKNY